MKILRIIARLNVGGPARHVVWLTDALNDDVYRSTLVAGTVPPGEEDMGYLADELNIKPVFIREMSRELSPKDAVSFFKLLRLIWKERPDVIHTHTAKAGTVGRVSAFVYKYLTPGSLIGRPRPVKIVHTFHGHVFHSYYGPAKTRLFIMIERVLARLATDRIITITGQQLEEINGTFRVGKSSQFEVIPLGIDLEPYGSNNERSSTRESIGVSDENILVGFVGRLTEIKNISMFLRSAKRASENDARLRFAIVGDGHLRERLERESESLGLAGIVQFLGNRTDVSAVYAATDIVALTSFNEGTPLSLIEAMAAGKAVISTRVGGVADLLGDKVSGEDGFDVYERGIGVVSDDAEGLARGLLCLAKDEKLRNELGSRGRGFVHAKYSKERLIADVKDLYKRLTS
ncbi:MAG: glycosyltransferase [Pyrinomonadaceae bacterium]|nr:glycosyltransferase [Pyrinomonadaceae bacterium]